MGVIYKLKPEIKDFILEQRKGSEAVSCRSLASLIESKFQIKVSKSSINSIFKQAGLSMPVGRRLKKKRPRQIKTAKLIEFKPLSPIQTKAEIPLEPPVIEPMPVPVPVPAPVPVQEQIIAPKVEQKISLEPEVPAVADCSGAVFLKAADYIMGGSHYLSEAIKNRLNTQKEDIPSRTEHLIYMYLLELEQEKMEDNLLRLWPIINKKIPLADILSYRSELQAIKAINFDIFRIIESSLRQVRCLKVDLVDGNSFYLDGQMHTVWSTPHIPHDFSSTSCNIKRYVNKYFYEDEPFTLFMAPGYDTPIKEFFYFLLGLDTQERKISKLTLYGNKFEDLETITIDKVKRRFFIFGLWPWQFVEFRKVNKMGEFQAVHFEPLSKDFFAAEVEIELSQPDVNQSVKLRGCAIKTSLSEKTRLIILTNLPPDLSQVEQVATTYLNHWPNLEEAFKDYSNKVELFTYTGSSQHFLSPETLNLQDKIEDANVLFGDYLKALDLYAKWHFLPLGSEEEPLPTVNEHFYSLKAILRREKGFCCVTFLPPPDYRFLKELEYACRRVNEKGIVLNNSLRLWFRV